MSDWAKHMNVWNIRLNRVNINSACGCMIEGKLPGLPVCPSPYVSTDADQKGVPLFCGYMADSVYESEIPINEIPEDARIIRMSNQIYVDQFFEDGSLKLGNLAEYAQAEHSEIGDVTEGVSIAVAQSANGTIAFELSNSDCVALCTYVGDPDPACIEKFGYDSCFEIVDPVGFVKAVSATIAADEFNYSECAYSKDKVIVVENFPRIDMSRIGFDTFKSTAGISRFFVKPDIYSHQCEFRFVWHGASKRGIIKCPEAIEFCRRVTI